MTSPAIEALLERMHHPSLQLIEPGLERVYAFLERLGNPQLKLPPVVHVAGTNGKGSTLAYLLSILRQGGYKVHRYTSPHLVSFNERIMLAGENISDAALIDVLERACAQIEHAPVTAFESTTAAAMLAFSEVPADVLLLEVGMGGRLDATNVLDMPLLTGITPVSFDHMGFLGNSLAAIAGEKAGIMKPGVPCVVGRQEAEAMAVIEAQAGSVGAPLARLGVEWQRDSALKPSLAGDFQLDNASMAAEMARRMTGFSLSEAQIAAGVAQTVWPGRLQSLAGSRLAGLLPPGAQLWLDGGHNAQGGEVLARWLKGWDLPVYLVCGMLRTKDAAGYFAPLAGQVEEVVCVTIENEVQSLPAVQLQMMASGVGMVAQSADSLEKALQSLAARVKTPCIVCICGSLSLVGQVLNKESGV